MNASIAMIYAVPVGVVVVQSVFVAALFVVVCGVVVVICVMGSLNARIEDLPRAIRCYAEVSITVISPQDWKTHMSHPDPCHQDEGYACL